MAPRILVIDDDNEFLNITKELLKKDGYNVMIMDMPTERLVTLSVRRRIDCIVVDIDAPFFHVVHSKDVFKRIFEGYKYPIVIYSSGHEQNSQRMVDEALMEKRFHFVKKAKPDELRRVVRKVIETYQEEKFITEEESDEMFKLRDLFDKDLSLFDEKKIDKRTLIAKHVHDSKFMRYLELDLLYRGDKGKAELFKKRQKELDSITDLTQDDLMKYVDLTIRKEQTGHHLDERELDEHKRLKSRFNVGQPAANNSHSEKLSIKDLLRYLELEYREKGHIQEAEFYAEFAEKEIHDIT